MRQFTRLPGFEVARPRGQAGYNATGRPAAGEAASGRAMS